eukprot:gene13592-18242_t
MIDRIPFVIGIGNQERVNLIHLQEFIRFSDFKTVESFHCIDDTDIKDDKLSSAIGRCLCMLSIPPSMIPTELIHYFSPAINRRYIQSIRVFQHRHHQIDDDKYIAVICTTSSEATEIEEEYCVLCLDIIRVSMPLSFTTCCNHKFHLECISRLEGQLCPVCRFQHDTSSKDLSECFLCGWRGRICNTLHGSTSSNSIITEPGYDRDLWVCLICGFTGCGHSNDYHIKSHYEDTLHAYSMNTDSRCVWDFAGNEFSTPFSTATTRDQIAPLNSDQEEIIINRKLESVAHHYNQLLAWQMEQNRLLFEKRLHRIRESHQNNHNNQTNHNNHNNQKNSSAIIITQNNQMQMKDWKQNIISSLQNEKCKQIKQCELAKEKLIKAQKELDLLQTLRNNLNDNIQYQNKKINNAIENLNKTEYTY